MVFGVQKGGFYIAKVWFLACKKGVFTLQKYGFCNAKVGILCMLLCYSKLQVYVGAQFYGICRYINNRKMQTVSSRRGPIYRARRYVNNHKMGNENAYLIMWKCVYDETNMYI